MFFIFSLFSSTSLENIRAKQALPMGGDWHQWEWGAGSGEVMGYGVGV
jgi:hypothetical protein